MKKKLTFLCLVAMLVFAASGCSGGQANGSSSRGGSSGSTRSPASDSAGLESDGAAMESKVQIGKTSDESQIAVPRKIIYTGEIHLACESLDIATEKLESRIKSFGGYIGNASHNGNRGAVRESTWMIRLPAEKFDSFIKFAVTIGELQSNSRQAQDVSEEFYDVEARLKNKKIEEARLVELLKKSTGKLSEILTVEKELSRVREEAERIEGRLRFLRNQTDLSTITVTIQEIKNFQPEGPPTVKTQVARTFDSSIDAMKQLGLAALLFVVAVIPWALPIGLVIWLIARKSRGPKVTNQEEQRDDSQPS